MEFVSLRIIKNLNKWNFDSYPDTLESRIIIYAQPKPSRDKLRAWWAARPEASASPGPPLGQDGRPSTCDISGPRRPPGTFDTPNRFVSSVSVGWWRSRGEVCWALVDFETAYDTDGYPRNRVVVVPRAARLLQLKKARTVARTSSTSERVCY